MSSRTTTAMRISVAQARALFLHAQGLRADPERRVSPSVVQRTIESLGFVQVDSIQAVERAHHLILHARLDAYRPQHLRQLLEQRRSVFEHWTHDAAVIPTREFRHWKPRFERYEERMRRDARRRGRLGEKPRAVMTHVIERIRKEGPLRSKDFEDPRGRRAQDWWDWKPQKAALEYLWHAGRLCIRERDGFQKVYDLTERVLPQVCDAPKPSDAEYVDWACRTALSRLGVATPGELADFWAGVTRAEAGAWCERALAKGSAIEVVFARAGAAGRSTANDATARRTFAPPDLRQRLTRIPEAPNRARLLAPFDPLVRDRARLQRLFGFDYRFEAFVPARARRYGYYTMPILEGSRFIGRLDPKLHRDVGTLEVRAWWWEPGIARTPRRSRSVERAIERLAELCGAERVVLPKR